MILFSRPLLYALGLYALGLLSVSAAVADDLSKSPIAPYRMAALSAFSPNDGVNLPPVLNKADVELYQQIFAAQKKGLWKKSNHLIEKLSDRVLIGHVMAQRYLHPTKYRSKYKELKDWMAKYADHPDARQIYKLALRRKPRTWRAPVRPITGNAVVARQTVRGKPPEPRKRLTRKQRTRARQLIRQIKSAARRGWTKAAKRTLGARETKKLLTTAEYDRASVQLGARYFTDGRDEWALKWAGDAANRSGGFASDGHWPAGLAAWRLGRYQIAAQHFEALAETKGNSSWFTSAGAFWAARSNLVAANPARVNRYLRIAADYPRTFYGQVAGRILGLPMPFQWTLPRMETQSLAALVADPGGRRAIALLQVGQTARAERDLRGLTGRVAPELAKGILILAARTGLARLAFRLDQSLYLRSNQGYDGAAFPVPNWQPDGGYTIDRALIFALIRQESGFNPKAKSGAGARGLMQIMPSTASFVARDRHLRGRDRKKLYLPEINLSLGQKYIEMLLSNNKVGTDLFRLAAAWNGGPGNLNKWRRTVKHLNDPLFFIESLPARETRNFIERVLTNLWIYRDRFGQATPSFDAIAAGEWPTYQPLDSETTEIAENGKD